MAVSENDLVVGPLVPAAGVTTISLDFYFEQAAWLEIYKSGSETPLVLDTDYTVTGAGSSSGVVTLATAANGTDSYSVYLAVPLQRSSDMQLRGEFKSEPFNIEMDRLWQALQGLNTQVGRSIRLPKASTAIAPLLPAPQAGRALAWNDAGDGLISAPIQVGDIASDLLAAQEAREGAEAAQEAAENINVDVDEALTAANAARDKAEKWAEESVDVEVETAKYSAKHHSEKASAQRVLAETAKTGAETARDAALNANGIFATTAAALGDGIQAVTGLTGGSGGTDGTYAVVATGGTEVIPVRGTFVVSSGAVTQIDIQHPGYYTADPTGFDFTASASLTGASATPVVGVNRGVGEVFLVPDGADWLAYEVASGPVATLIARIPGFKPSWQEMCWPIGEDIPAGWYATGQTRKGQQLLVSWHPELLFLNGEDGAIYDIQDASTLWQNLGETIPADSDDDSVLVLKDVSGNGHDLDATASGLVSPKVRMLGDGYSYIETNGINKMLTGASGFASALTDYPTLAVACSNTSTANTAYPLAVANTGAARYASLRMGDDTQLGLWVQGGTLESGLKTGFEVGPVTMIAQPRSGVCYVNGKPTTTFTPPTFAAMDSLSLGGVDASTRIFGKQNIYAAIAIDRPLTDTEIVLLDKWLAVKSPVGEARRADIYALWGQSNTVGRAVYDSALDHPPTGIWQFSLAGSIKGLIRPTNPLNHTGASSGDFGPDLSFSLARIAADPDTPIVFLAAAEGATGFSNNNWNDGDTQHEAAVSLWNKFKEMYDADVTAFLGFIGEKDANDAQDGAAFSAALDAAVSAFRSSVNGADANTPVILFNLADDFVTTANPTYGPGIRAALEDSEDRLHNCGVVDVAGLGTSDNTHLDTAGMYAFGRRIDRKMREIGV